MTPSTSTKPEEKSPAISSSNAPAAEDRLATEGGKISVAQGVVQKVAGMACREISGVHAMGTGGSRRFGAIKERIPGSSGSNVSRASAWRSAKPRRRSTWTLSWSTA